MYRKEKMDPLISSFNSNEYFNSICHLIGAILSLAGLIVLIVFSAMSHRWIHLVSFSIYGTTLFLSFLASCLLHFNLLFDRYSRVLGILDHCAIYLLIAGTYTPFCLAILDGATGWSLFGIIWGIAVFLITIKAIFFSQLSILFSNLSYMVMGWLVVFFIYPIYLKLGVQATILMVTGGLFYSLGALVFTKDWPDPWPPFFGNHEIWHLCVLFGNATFFFVMLFYVSAY